MSVLSETMRSAIDSDLSEIVNSGEFSEQITLFELIQINPSETIGFENEPGELIGYKPHQLQGHFTRNFYSIDKEGFERNSQTARVQFLDSQIPFDLKEKNFVQVNDENFCIKSSELAGRGAKNYHLAKLSTKQISDLQIGSEYYLAHLSWLEANP
jgi:hypothetical protein